MRKFRHQIPLGTYVSFGLTGSSVVYEVSNYQTVHCCTEDCPDDHDHFEEPCIAVTEKIGKVFPLSKLEWVFDRPNHSGRKPTQQELTVVEAGD